MNLQVPGEGIVRDFDMVVYTLLYLKCITNKNLLHGTWNSLSVMCWPGCEGNLEEKNGYIYLYDLSPFTLHVKLPQHCLLAILQLKNRKFKVWGKKRKCRPLSGEGNGNPLQYSCLENPRNGGAWWAAVHGVTASQARLSKFILTFHFPALGKEMAIKSSVLAWRIQGTGEPGRLQSMESHRVGHD